MQLYFEGQGATIYHGDCLDVLRELPDCSVDSVVTDPPYGLEFMGKDWDAPWRGDVRQRDDNTFKQGDRRHGLVRHGMSASYGGDSRAAMSAFGEWCELWAAECLRVLKPGGHLLAFGGTRTWHRLAVAIEDAGFEIRDSIAWMYGSGFPKSLDVSKAIDKAAGAERQMRVNERWADRYPNGPGGNLSGDNRSEHFNQAKRIIGNPLMTSDPATPDAARWQGWGTALKPAHEPVVVARKPLMGTVAANVLEHGTGALNIDGCRIGTEGETTKGNPPKGSSNGIYGDGINGACDIVPLNAGRWPANVVLDEDQAAALDKQSGTLKSPGSYRRSRPAKGEWLHGKPSGSIQPGFGDSGGASRFFYVAKAPARERPKVDGIAHPTVKPLTLMRWLCRLVTPPGGTVLEPFAGSGTTVEAALLEGFRVVAIEREPDYLPLIAARLERVNQEPDDGQLTFDASA